MKAAIVGRRGLDYCHAPAQHARPCRAEATAQYLHDPDAPTIPPLSFCPSSQQLTMVGRRGHHIIQPARPPPESQPLRRARCCNLLDTSTIHFGTCHHFLWLSVCGSVRSMSSSFGSLFQIVSRDCIHPPAEGGLSILVTT